MYGLTEMPFDLEALRREPVGTIIFGVDNEGYVNEFHVCEEGAVAGGRLDGRWEIVNRNLLTVHPSIHCHGCGLHGWIRLGTWEPC